MIDTMKENIMLVDDDKFLLGMYSTKFAASGFLAQACLSAKEALEALRGGFSPSAILFDITMPEMDGFTFLQALSSEKLAEHALKIALTNQSDDAEKAKATELGAALYVVKASVIPSEVVNIVTDALAKQRVGS